MATVSIALTGPESSGKTTLAEQLANHFTAVWIAEYARQYLQDIGTDYSLFDLELIAMGHTERMLSYRQLDPPLVFLDTDLVNMKVWAEDKFKTEIPFVEENIYVQKADLYLLCAPDLPWLADPLRQDPHRLSSIFEKHRQALNLIDARYTLISGMHHARLKSAITAVETFLREKNILFGQPLAHE